MEEHSTPARVWLRAFLSVKALLRAMPTAVRAKLLSPMIARLERSGGQFLSRPKLRLWMFNELGEPSFHSMLRGAFDMNARTLDKRQTVRQRSSI